MSREFVFILGELRWARYAARMEGEEDRVYVIGRKTEGNETTRKTKM
jgi:hypothetical protein